MITIIEDWLFSNLGLNLNLNKLTENNLFQDGCILADILHKYGLINTNFRVNIIPTSEKVQCKKNLQLLKPMFDMIKVGFGESVILGIVGNKPSSTLRLLYELYVSLENKQHLYFITKQNYEKIQRNLIENVHELRITKNVELETSEIPESTCFEQPLIQNKDIIEWYKNKYKLIKDNLDESLKTLNEEQVSSRSNVIAGKNRKRCSCKYSSSLETEEPLPDLGTFLKYNNHDNLLNYNQFITSFKEKQHKNIAKKYLEESIQNHILHQTWNKVMERQNKIYNTIFSNILLKQSQYEKQILTKLIQTQNQIPIQNENQSEVTKQLMSEEEKRINRDFKLQEDFEKLRNIYEAEQKRVLELHKKLYKEKQDLIKKRHYSLCSDIINDLIDLSISASEFKLRYGTTVPKQLWNGWKQLFFKSKPLKIPFVNLENELMQGNDIDYDDVIAFEIIEDNILSDIDVEEYLLTTGQWFYKDICSEYDGIDENILAFIIYRLISLKYPLPETPLPADLPPFKLSGVLLNLHCLDSIEKLKILLTKPRIHVFDAESAIKTCISTFQNETAINFEKKEKDNKRKFENGKQKSKSQNKLSKEGKKKNSNKITEKIREKIKPEILIDRQEEKYLNLVDKETQTSIINELEKEKLKRTSLGLIGEEVFTILKEGGQVDDKLLVSVIMEYLKTLQDFEGWLILNYPLTLHQASVIELALTGRYIKEDTILDYGQSTHEFQLEEVSKKWKSKLLSPPITNSSASAFKSHFSVVTRLKENIIHQSLALNEDFTTDSFPQNEKESVGKKSREEEVTGESQPGLDALEIFYKDQSIFKEFSFDSMDFATLKKLARTILKEDDKEATKSIDLFGEECLNKLDKTKKTKKGKSASGRRKSTGKKKKEMKRNDSKTLVADPENINENFELQNVYIETSPPVEQDLSVIKPGDEDWENILLPIHNELGIILATVWERIENCYLSNLKCILFENRVINLRLIPYSTYIQEEVDKIVNTPDLRQNLVNIFQNYYNSFGNELRKLPEFKSQLHCKVLEMQNSLWEIANQKRQEIEQKRQDIIHENWLVTELCMLINNYLSLVQTEFDRSFQTMQLLSDYYLSMLGKVPSTLINIQHTHTCVDKLTEDKLLCVSKIPSNKLENVISRTLISDSEGSKSQISDDNFIKEALISCGEEEAIIHLLNSFLSQEIIHAKNQFQSTIQHYYFQIKSEGDMIASLNKKSVKEKTKGSQKQVFSKLRSEKSKKKSSQNETITEKYTEKGANKDAYTNELLIEEWRYVVDMEKERFSFRLDLISKQAVHNIMEFYCYLESIFCQIFRSTLTRYNTDISNINNICYYFKTAIEEESLLDQSVVLNKDMFFININKNSRSKCGDVEVKNLIEDAGESCFTITQLNKLVNVFKIAGPFGVIRKQPLCYILQDLALFNSNDNTPHMPRVWSQLDAAQLRYVVDHMFGPEYAIDWRDFIIYNLGIPYPNIHNILAHRQQFLLHDPEETEIIALEAYENVTLWFQEDLPSNPHEALKVAMVKHLLFELFKIDENHINYTALLLYFCKDFEPKNGFRKALCLALGKNVITCKDELIETLKNEAEIKDTVITLLQNIITSIINDREGISITEVFHSGSQLNFDHEESNKSCTILNVLSDSDSNSMAGQDSIVSAVDAVSIMEEEGSVLSYRLNEKENKKSHYIIETPDKPWASKISIDVVISVLNASFIYQDKNYTLRDQYLLCLEEEADDEGMIEAHVLVALSCIQKLFALTNKFKISLPCSILEQCLKTY